MLRASLLLSLSALATFLVGAVLGGCVESEAEPGSDVSDVVVDTSSERAWAQYLANVRFYEQYVPTCAPLGQSARPRPRVLVTGFGRFLNIPENATGRIVEALAPGLVYPLTEPPVAGDIDDPALQTAAAEVVVDLPGVGEVELCAMVLPVFWDLAAALLLAEAEAFRPDLIVMNGVAGPEQPLWLELGAVNQAVGLRDGSGILAALPGSPVLSEIPDALAERGNLLSWQSVREAAERAIAEHADAEQDGRPLSEVLTGVRYAGFPRASNTYLCNDTTFIVSTLLDHPGHVFRLLEPSHPREGGPTGLDVASTLDPATPRVFVHWPSTLRGEHVERAKDVLAAQIAAQLTADRAPERGHPDMAEVW